MGLYCYNYNNATWENEPLKQILRRGLRANAFDRTADTLHATVSSATRAADECDGILIDSGDDQEPSSITLSSPINLPSPIAPIDERRDKVMDEPHLNTACQVDNDMVSPDTSTSSISPPPPPSPPTSSPPPPPQEPFEVISENKAKEEPGSEAKEVTEIVGEDNKSQTKVSASDALDENTGILPLPPPPPSPPTSEDEVNDTNDEGSDTKENTDDSEEYTGSFDSLSLSGEEYMYFNKLPPCKVACTRMSMNQVN